jgi:hypothetical protein
VKGFRLKVNSGSLLDSSIHGSHSMLKNNSTLVHLPVLGIESIPENISVLTPTSSNLKVSSLVSRIQQVTEEQNEARLLIE